MMYDAERYTHRSIYYFQCLYISTVVIYNKEKSLKRAALSFSFSFFSLYAKETFDVATHTLNHNGD
jgi:hypothetical protein